ncbi:MAG: hypothetical protein RIB78_11635 [Gammaproteobacteria bacterium]
MQNNPTDFNRLNNSGPRKTGWLTRLASVFSKKRFSRDAIVHPCVINGVQTLVYPRGLAKKDPRAFRVIKQYAHVNGFNLKEDQRADFLEGVKRVQNKKLANVVSVIALSAKLGLMSHPVAAAEVNRFTQSDFAVTSSIQHVSDHVINLDSYDNEKDLAKTLMLWIGQHTSLPQEQLNVPEITKVSGYEIASIAFGGQIPKNVDPEKLQIYGLYNFHEKTVYLLDSIDLDTTEGKSILLHELVHFIQYEMNLEKDAACMNELEALAYTLEARFLDTNQHHHNISKKYIDKISQCKT